MFSKIIWSSLKNLTRNFSNKLGISETLTVLEEKISKIS